MSNPVSSSDEGRLLYVRTIQGAQIRCEIKKSEGFKEILQQLEASGKIMGEGGKLCLIVEGRSITLETANAETARVGSVSDYVTRLATIHCVRIIKAGL